MQARHPPTKTVPLRPTRPRAGPSGGDRDPPTHACALGLRGSRPRSPAQTDLFPPFVHLMAMAGTLYEGRTSVGMVTRGCTAHHPRWRQNLSGVGVTTAVHGAVRRRSAGLTRVADRPAGVGLPDTQPRPAHRTTAMTTHRSHHQTLRCIAALEQRGWVESTKSTIQHGYELRQATVWSLSWSDGCMEVLSFLRDVPTQRPRETDDEVPQRFWRSFWSGASADTLRISQHGLHIAETLVGGRDPCARAWALSALPTGVLQECRALRGFDTGLRAELLDGEIARRAVAP